MHAAGSLAGRVLRVQRDAAACVLPGVAGHPLRAALPCHRQPAARRGHGRRLRSGRYTASWVWRRHCSALHLQSVALQDISVRLNCYTLMSSAATTACRCACSSTLTDCQGLRASASLPRTARRNECAVARTLRCSRETTARLAAVQVLARRPHSQDAVFAWHQDVAYWPPFTQDASTVTCWLAVTDATVDNGCMRFVPGSHAEPSIRPHVPGGCCSQALG